MTGHAQAERDFLDAWNSGRLAHAWLTGPKGIGKATLAHSPVSCWPAVAAADYRTPDTLALILPIRWCIRCRPKATAISRWWNAAMPTTRKASCADRRRRRAQIGDLFHQTADAGWRVVLIDAADEMNRNAANAVLKILEEPPTKALILMVSHSPGRLLPTIRSRCRRLALNPLPSETICQLMATHRPDLTTAEIQSLANLGEGSLGKALALAEDGGLDLYRDLVGLLSALPKLDVPALHAFAERVGRADADSAWRTVTELTVWWLARLVRAGGRQGRGMVEVVPGEAALMGRLLAAASLDRWLDLWEKTGSLFAKADAVNLDRKQALLTAFLALERLSRA